MKIKTLTYLTIALVLLGGLAWFNQQNINRRNRTSTGQPVLPNFDPNAVTRIVLHGGPESLELIRWESGWTVASRWNYPLDFAQLSGTLRKLADLKIGDVIPSGRANLEEFGLATTNNLPTLPADLQLIGSGGVVIARIVLGQPRTSGSPEGFAMPDSQFALVDDRPVLLVTPYLEEIPRRPEDWMDRHVLDIEASTVTAIQAQLADGTLYGVKHGESGFTGDGTLAGKNINTAGADLWARTLQGLSVVTVYDPTSDRKALGFDKPDVVEFQTKEGIAAKVQLGQAEESGDRPALISLSWLAPPLGDEVEGEKRAAVEKEQQAISEKVTALQKRVTPWIYKLSNSTAKQLTMLPDQLTIVAPSTNAPPAP